jgi:hypothetical protein
LTDECNSDLSFSVSVTVFGFLVILPHADGLADQFEGFVGSAELILRLS